MPASAATLTRRDGHSPPSRGALRQPELLWLAGLVVAAAVVRFAVVGVPSYWLDEAFTILILKAPFGHALSLIPDTESTPPLYYVLAWGWAKLFGTGEAGVRSLSALFGTATVPVGYAIGTRLLGRRTGLITAALLAFNPFLIWFAQEARAYALMVLLCAVSFWLFIVWLDERRTRPLVAWGLVSALAFATHYYAAVMLAAELGWMLFAVPDARRRVLAAFLPVVAVGLALLPLAVAQRSNRLAVPLGEESSTVLRTLQVPKQFAVGFDAPAELVLSIVCLALAVTGVGLLVARRTRADHDRVAPAAVVGAAVLIVPVLLALTGFDYVSARYEVAGLVPLAVCVAAGFAAPAARRTGLTLAAALCAIWLAVVIADARDPLLQTRADWRHAAAAIGPVPPGGRAIVLTPAAGRKPFEVYLPAGRLLKAPVASVREVVLLSVRSTARDALAPLAPPLGTLPASLPGFTEVQRTRTRTYVLVRYRAARQLPVSLAGLGGGRLDPLPFVALLQR